MSFMNYRHVINKHQTHEQDHDDDHEADNVFHIVVSYSPERQGSCLLRAKIGIKKRNN